MFIEHLNDIDEPILEVEMFTVDNLWNHGSIEGLKRVMETVKALLDLHDNEPVRKRNIIAGELVFTDRRYLKDLEALQQYATAILHSDVLEKDDPLYLLLSCVDQLVNFQRSFREQLAVNLQRPSDKQWWGEPFLQYQSEFLVYAMYSKYYRAAALSSRKTEKGFPQSIVYTWPGILSYRLSSWLPVQRIPRYTLLLN
ncbi:Dbl homology domain-containing protein [Marasmius fiardii PR-910]|nr:Dbl homology domain-containing protein [Marasmius fiardii PR-910]